MYFDDSRFCDSIISVTQHAKERLYERFPELCAMTDGFAETIKHMIQMGQIEDAMPNLTGTCLSVTFGDVGLIVAGNTYRMNVITVVNCNLWAINTGTTKKRRNMKKRRKIRVNQFTHKDTPHVPIQQEKYS